MKTTIQQLIAKASLRPEFLVIALALLGSPRLPAAEPAPSGSLFDDAATEYKKREAAGLIPKLIQRLNDGEARLRHDPNLGYLPALLEELDIPISSQVLVFSKTSSQRHEVSPRSPRALYYNDRVSVAYYPGSASLQIAATDPNLGVGFYRMEQERRERPRFSRDDRCLECHLTTRTLGVPGWTLRSFLTGEDGDIDPLGGSRMVTHRTRFEERWGGYYVTGKHGDLVHLGNLFGAEAIARHAEEPGANGNVTNLLSLIEVGSYPATESDIVSLLVLDHQAGMLNLLMRLRFEAEAALKAGLAARATDSTAEAALRYMLFVDEVPLRSPVVGTSRFATEFQKQGPWDAAGRSLRELDLKSRLLKHPCSFMIHSEAFDLLPEQVRRHLYRRLWEILNGEDPSPEFRRIQPETRRAIREILTATKKDLPVYWRL